jgi:formate hydrogenlyase subunit 6/NADH:ubiquinone oxidoreductase subunit I
MGQFFLAGDRVPEFVAHLMNQKPVYAPHQKGRKSFSFERTENPADVVLDYPRTMQSVRKYFLPPREELLTFDLTKNDFDTVDIPINESIFLGVHSYDLAAVGRLDYNFTVGSPERNYLTRREGAIFIGVSFVPDKFHFSGSVGIRPDDNSGCDIFLTKLLDGYVLEVLTSTGRKLMEGLELPPHETGKPPTEHFRQHIYVPQAKLSEIMERSYDNAVWEETATKCVGCGTCNLVCPTCYCFNVEENVDISVTKGSRERHWDGCMLRKFSEVAGGEVFRESLASRQRHRIFRKFKYISDQTGQPWCVGCGRCTAYCTAGISIVGIVNRLISDYEKVTVAPV